MEAISADAKARIEKMQRDYQRIINDPKRIHKCHACRLTCSSEHYVAYKSLEEKLEKRLIDMTAQAEKMRKALEAHQG